MSSFCDSQCWTNSVRGLGAVAGHIVMIGRVGPLQLVNRLDHVGGHGIEVVPVMRATGYRHRAGATDRQANPSTISSSWQFLLRA
jgi:hypothetical protein